MKIRENLLRLLHGEKDAVATRGLLSTLLASVKLA